MIARENQYATNASEESQMVSYSWSYTFHSAVLPFLLCSHLYLQCCIPCWSGAEASKKHGNAPEEENSFVQIIRLRIKAEDDLTLVRPWRW